MKYYAVVRWLPGDIKTLRPGWTNKMCVKFLESKEQAAFIVRACNSHEALIKSLQGVIAWAETCQASPKDTGYWCDLQDEIKAARETIKQAEGKI